MQEFLIPTLAFIAGPGEINYWGELKQAFAVMGFKMPPVMPRLNITILERHIEKNWLNGISHYKTRLSAERRIKERHTSSARFRKSLRR